MQIDKSFYVYAHFDEHDKVFYVGKGSGPRARSKRDRGTDWNERAKNGYTIQILRRNLSEQCALCMESIIIHSIGLDNLSNKLNGIYGNYSAEISDDTRKQISISLSGRKATKQQKLNMSLAQKGRKISKEMVARIRQNYKWEDHPKLDKTERTFFHEIYGEVRMIRYMLCNTYGLPNSKVSEMISGKRKSVKGWRMKN